jgi:hypothetical protein
MNLSGSTALQPIIVFNLPFRGNRLLFSDKGLKDDRQLYAFLEEHHFEIEHKTFPKRPRKETDESEELIVLVALCSSLSGDAESVQGQTPEAYLTGWNQS